MTKAYILQGPMYYRYDVEADAVDAGYPREISDGWSSIDSRFTGGADTAIDTGSGHLYFFEGDTYQRIV
jgi:hypothetical protein